MKNRNSIIITCLFLSIVFLTTGTFAYFRRGATGNVNVNTGKLTLSINDKSAYKSETFEVVLTNADGSNLKPGDSGSFNLELDASGSSFDVSVNLELSRTNLPDNLKFYLDSEHTKLFTKRKYDIEKSSSMVENVTIYWYWEDLEESNDNDFMFTEISAEITGTVSYFEELPLYDTIALSGYTLDTGVDFSLNGSSTNGQGLMMRSDTENDEYPILYYRGDVTDNNVIFADLCWLIVRTTETGGVKLIYNGEVNNDGTCNNYSGVGGVTANSNYTDVFVNNTVVEFNSSSNSPVYVGYMYNDDAYEYSRSTLTTGYVAHLADETIDQATGRHVQNLKDSNIKSIIDDWYEDNIYNTDAENLLEDTVWCNDRSMISEIFTIKDYADDLRDFVYFAARTRLHENRFFTGGITPSLSCTRTIDKFTVDRANGNGDLTYSIGLLTADELTMAGQFNGGEDTVEKTYLALSYEFITTYWLISPGQWSGEASVSSYFGGLSTSTIVDNDSSGARPSVSLSNGAKIKSGDGSFEKPYVIG